MGFIIWDRRTTLAPVVREMEELKQRQKTQEKVLKTYAKKDVKFKEVMQTAELL